MNGTVNRNASTKWFHCSCWSNVMRDLFIFNFVCFFFIHATIVSILFVIFVSIFFYSLNCHFGMNIVLFFLDFLLLLLFSVLNDFRHQLVQSSMISDGNENVMILLIVFNNIYIQCNGKSEINGKFIVKILNFVFFFFDGIWNDIIGFLLLLFVLVEI